MDPIAPEKEVVGKCPKCGKNIYQGKTKTNKVNYYCEGYKEGYKFTLWQESKHFSNSIKITKTKAKQLLKEEGKAVSKLKSKAGKEYEGYLKLKLNGNYVNFEAAGFLEKKK